jgi:hypothetical protein
VHQRRARPGIMAATSLAVRASPDTGRAEVGRVGLETDPANAPDRRRPSSLLWGADGTQSPQIPRTLERLAGASQVRGKSVECRKMLRTDDNQRQASGLVGEAFEPVTRFFATAARALTSRGSSSPLGPTGQFG